MSQHGCPERLSNRSKGFQEDGSSQPTMEVLVETLTGTAFEMTVSPSDTIFAIKSKIYRVEGIPVSQQHLLYNLRELDDGLSLSEHAIADGARLRLVLGLRGGPVATRRLPPPEPWRDLERFLHLHKSDEDDSEWNGSSSGCKATVLVFREGERVNLVPVRENRDGTYSPLDHAKYSSSLSHLSETETGEAGGGAAAGGGALSDNAVTLAKMMELRRRMDRLALHRRPPDRTGDTHDIQKTRSEETLSVPSLLDDSSEFAGRSYAGYGDEEGFAPLYDGSYTRYDYDCGFADRYALLPPIGARADSEHSVQDAADERVKLSDALAGSILVKARDARDDDAILEEVLDGEPCLRRGDGSLAPIQATDYGAVSVGARWRRSSSSLGARAAPLADTLFCSSTSDLEQLRRNRILPALSRHRNREHLHLSDEGLDLTRPEPGPEPPAPRPEPRAELDKKARVRCAFCRKRLSIATEHTCRCGASFCAPHRYAEVHGCAYDYKQRARALLRRDNPAVQAPKLPKI